MQTAHPVEYATPSAQKRSYWPEAILSVLGLGLIFLGGCFLIGVASVYDIFLLNPSPNAGPKSPGETAFVAVLYLAATLCFIGAATVIGIAVVRLSKK